MEEECDKIVFNVTLTSNFHYNIVSNISCRFLCKIKMQYLQIFLLVFYFMNIPKK